MDGCSFYNCTGGYGGALHIHNCMMPLLFRNCTFRDCHSTLDGGHDLRIRNISIGSGELSDIFVDCYTVCF
jgi:hypothetical protein